MFLDYGLDVSNNIYTDFTAKVSSDAEGNTQRMSLSAIRTR